jgi:hypothetical protein
MRHLVIPDCQVRPGDDLSFLSHIGKYIVDKRPDKIICLGDFADMPSLSSYDVGKKSYEGRRYMSDVESVDDAMATLLAPLHRLQERQKFNRKKIYTPEQHMMLGNHENRINRAVNNDAKLEGLMSTFDLAYEYYDWEVHNFLEVAVIDNIAYSHYFVTGVAGRPASSAMAQLRKTNMSCISGHQQGLQIATASRADGALLTSVIAGSCYEHQEDYLGPQGNKHWRGVLVLNDVHDGQFDLMPLSLKYLREEYGN